MKDTNRPKRVAELIKRELAVVIAREWEDPAAAHITLTHAEISRDFSSAKVFFTLMGGGEAKAAEQALNRATGFLRRALSGRMRLRAVPALHFYFDESVERSARLTDLIERAVAEDERRKGG